MKTFIRISIVLVVIALFVTSCTMEKRVYRPGFHVDWNNKDNSEKPDIVQQPTKVAASVNENIIPLAEIQESVSDAVTDPNNVSDNSFAGIKTTVKENIINKPVTESHLNKSEKRHFAVIGNGAGLAAPFAMKNGGDNQLIAFLLCFFLGMIGIHSFYLGNKKKGIIQLVMAIVGGITSVILIGFVILAVLGVWVFVDLIRIIIGDLGPGW